MTQWEYVTGIVPHSPEGKKMLDQLGADGWEAVSASPIPVPAQSPLLPGPQTVALAFACLFKRPVKRIEHG